MAAGGFVAFTPVPADGISQEDRASDSVPTPRSLSTDASEKVYYSEPETTFDGKLTLITIGGSRDQIKFDHDSSYGWLIHMAKEFWNKNTCQSTPAKADDIQLGFCINGKKL